MAIQPSIQTRTRTRTPANAAPQSTPPANPAAVRASAPTWMKSGAAARQAADLEMQRQREAAERRANGLYMPFRFRTKVGEQREIIILDQADGISFYEHNLQNPRTGKWDLFEACPKEWEPCPLCDGVAGGKESYYVMMLTCIDLTPWVNKKGETIPYSKFLLPVKAQQQGFFHRQLERHGGLRGLHLLMARDNPQGASIGNAEFIEKHTEEEILASFGHEQVVDQQGKVIKAKNADCYPYDYSKLFKKPSGDDLRQRYGGMAPAGSRQEARDEWADDDTPHEAADSPAEDIPM